MKTRQGFVSNSSTSSFVAVAVRDRDIINQAKEKLGLNELGEYWWQKIEEKGFEETGHGLYQHLDTGLELIGMRWDGEISLIGLQIHDLLDNDNFTVGECKETLVTMFADLGIDIDLDLVKFEFGECSNGS